MYIESSQARCGGLNFSFACLSGHRWYGSVGWWWRQEWERKDGGGGGGGACNRREMVRCWQGRRKKRGDCGDKRKGGVGNGPSRKNWGRGSGLE